jgi:hypothetical protein
MSQLPVVDLRRLDFERTGLFIEEHSLEKLQVATEDWIFFLMGQDSESAKNSESTHRSMASKLPDCRLELIESPTGARISKFLSAMDGPNRAWQVRFDLSFGDASAYGAASHRLCEPFDIQPIDDLLLSMRLLDEPPQGVEVPPAWVTYQRDRQAGSPIAKFHLTMEPAPVILGKPESALHDWTPWTEEEFESGGRQLGPTRFEFYAKADPLSIRLDLRLVEPPARADREHVFEATLQVQDDRISVSSFDTFYSAPIPTGKYNVKVTRVNPDVESDRMLTDSESFGRDDLERYEIIFTRQDEPDLKTNP